MDLSKADMAYRATLLQLVEKVDFKFLEADLFLTLL